MNTHMFFQYLYQDSNPQVSLAPFLNNKPGSPQFVRNGDLSQSIKWYINKGYDLFFTVNISGSTLRLDTDIKKSYCFFIDVDDTLLPKYFPLEPSAIISREDGKGHHIYWFLKDPIVFNTDEDRKDWTAIQKKLIDFYKSDKVIHNPARIMRVPETFNNKSKVIKQYGKPLQYIIKQCNETYYSIEEIVTAHTSKKSIDGKLNQQFKDIFGSEKLHDGEERHKKMIQAAYVMHDHGLSKVEIFEKLKKLNNTKLADQYDEQKLKSIANSIKYAKNTPGVKVVEDTIREQKKIALVAEVMKDWYFVENGCLFVNINKPMKPITREVFNARFASYTEQADSARYAFRHELLLHADQFVYEPQRPVICEYKGETCINMWTETQLQPIKPLNNIPEVFLNHVEYLFSNELEREYFLDYLAHMVQKPREKIRHSLIITGKQGIGKSVFRVVFEKLFGYDNVSSPSNSDLTERFTGWAKHCQVCFIDEVEQAEKKEFVNKIKPFISETKISIREMYKGSYDITNYMSIIATTNSAHPILLSGDDRRFMILQSHAEQKDSNYYTKLFNYCENMAGEILWFLQNRDVSSFQPGARPPVTEAKKEIIQYSKSDLQVNIEDMIDSEEWPFKNDLVCVSEIYEYFQSNGKNKFITKNRITLILREIGCVFIEQQVRIGTQRQRFWCIRNKEKWSKISETDQYSNVVKSLFHDEDSNNENKVVFLK